MTTVAPANLFRSLLKEARKMPDYNFRSYAVRRVKAGFKKSNQLRGEEATMALQEGKVQLEMLKRQAALGQMYPSARSVME